MISVIYNLHDLTKLTESGYFKNIFYLIYKCYKIIGILRYEDIKAICLEVHGRLHKYIVVHDLKDTNFELLSTVYGLSPDEFWDEFAADHFRNLLPGLQSLLHTLDEEGLLKGHSLLEINKVDDRTVECILSEIGHDDSVDSIVQLEITRLQEEFMQRRLNSYRTLRR